MYSITNIKNTDIDEVLSLDKECFSDNWSRKELEDIVSRENKTDIVLIYRSDKLSTEHNLPSSLIGYGIVRILSKEGINEITEDKKDPNSEAEILRIQIRKELRNKGLGKKLFSEMMNICNRRFIPKIYLEVRTFNAPAIKIYEQNGFVKTGTRKNYYQNPQEDATLMTKTNL